jgi:hypothetical protein
VTNIFKAPSITSRDINGLQQNERASPSAVRILCRFVIPLHPLASFIDAHYPCRKEWQVPLDKFSGHHDDLPHQQPLYFGGSFIMNPGKNMGIALQRKRNACMPETIATLWQQRGTVGIPLG